MPTNYPGPFEVRLKYAVTHTQGGLKAHEQRFSFVPGTDPGPGSEFSEYDYVAKDSSLGDLETWVNDWADLVSESYNGTDTTFTSAEIWKYVTGTFNADFQSSMELTADGQSGLATNPASEVIFTFRSQGGGHARIILLDTVETFQQPQPYPTAVTRYDNLMAAVVAADSPVYARDNTYLFSPLTVFRGQSEAVFKSRYRP